MSNRTQNCAIQQYVPCDLAKARTCRNKFYLCRRCNQTSGRRGLKIFSDPSIQDHFEPILGNESVSSFSGLIEQAQEMLDLFKRLKSSEVSEGYSFFMNPLTYQAVLRENKRFLSHGSPPASGGTLFGVKIQRNNRFLFGQIYLGPADMLNARS